MASSTAKRVVLYRFGYQPLEGVVNPSAYLLEDHLELISLTGVVHRTPYMDCKALCFVFDTSETHLFDEPRLFERRPKLPGLWTRFSFRDNDQLDGILPPNLLEWPSAGYLITPPKAGANRQRVFIPRAAVVKAELRGVVGGSTPKPKRKRPATAGGADQLTMFGS